MNGQPRRFSNETKTNKHYKTELAENKDNAKHRKKNYFLLISSEKKGHCIYGTKIECHKRK